MLGEPVGTVYWRSSQMDSIYSYAWMDFTRFQSTIPKYPVFSTHTHSAHTWAVCKMYGNASHSCLWKFHWVCKKFQKADGVKWKVMYLTHFLYTDVRSFLQHIESVSQSYYSSCIIYALLIMAKRLHNL